MSPARRRWARVAALLVAGVALAGATPGQEPAASAEQSLRAELNAHQAAARLLDAARTAEKLLEAVEARLEPDDPALIPALDDAARLASATGDYLRAQALYERSLALRKAKHGARSEEAATGLDMVAMQHWSRGDYEVAEPLLLEALEIREEILEPDAVMLATRVQVLAGFYMARFDFARAEALYRRALEIHEAREGPEGSSAAGVHVALAFLHKTRGDLRRAEKHFGKALAVYEAGGPHMRTATAAFRETLATIYEEQGREEEARESWEAAEALYREQMKDQAAQFGEESAVVLASLRLLANHMQRRGRLDEARKLYRRVLAAERKLYAGREASLLGTWMALAQLEKDAGRLDEARRLYEGVLEVQRRIWGDVHSLSTVQMLATVDEAQGRWEDAARRVQEALTGWERAFSEHHPVIVPLEMRLGLIRWAQGRTEDALEHVLRSQDLVEPQLRALLATGTEEDRRATLARYAYHVDVVASLDAAANEPAATRMALRTVLRRKGRLLDAMADTVGTLRRRLDPEGRKLFERLNAARARMAKLVTRGPAAGEEALYRKTLTALEDEIRGLEVAISQRSAEFRVRHRPVTVEAVQAGLPEDTALVEYVVYRAVDPKRGTEHAAEGPRRLAAWVLKPEGEPTRVDLGPMEPVAKAVAALREELSTPDSVDAKEKARAVDRLVMEPVRKALGSTRRLLVAPDGALNLVPFAALVDEHDHFLVRRYHVTYLSSGRDLLGLDLEVPARGGPVIFADPDFTGSGGEAEDGGGTGGEEVPRSRGRRARSLGGRSWAPLPGTRREADALAGVLAEASVRTGAEATEGALKGVGAPRVLHVATHGFFLAGRDEAAAPENPLLRSGLALAGANRLESGPDDGVLTALEASGLDLWGTRLVVLSACETGVGDVEAGDGVYGLRRALVMAGAESQVLSLWQVDDEATRELMVGFYERLLRGRPRGESLRAMQLRMLRDPMTEHPYYWAAFIPAGDWRPIAGE